MCECMNFSMTIRERISHNLETTIIGCSTNDGNNVCFIKIIIHYCHYVSVVTFQCEVAKNVLWMWTLAARTGPYMISRNVLPESNLITRYTMTVRLLDVTLTTQKLSKSCMQMQYFNNVITNVQETRKPQIRKRELNWGVSRLYQKNTLQILSNPRQQLIILSFMNRQAWVV